MRRGSGGAARPRGAPALRRPGRKEAAAGARAVPRGCGEATCTRCREWGSAAARPPCPPRCREPCALCHGARPGLGRAGAALRRLAAHRGGLAAPILAVHGPASTTASRSGGGGGRRPGAARGPSRPEVPTGAVAASLGASSQQPGAPARGTAGRERGSAGSGSEVRRADPPALCSRVPGQPFPSRRSGRRSREAPGGRLSSACVGARCGVRARKGRSALPRVV